MRILTLLKNAYRRFTGGSIIVETAVIFTLITLVNSIMMVVGWDQPKVGASAYLHLLGRLGIVSLVVVIWDYDMILSYLKRLSSKQSSSRAWQSCLGSIRKNCFSTVAVLFTTTTAFPSAVIVLFRKTLQPVAGEWLYWSLLAFIAVLTVSVLTYDKAFRRSQA